MSGALFTRDISKGMTDYTGSSRGRGPRAAGWFQDVCQVRGSSKLRSMVLLEGIKGWALAGQEYTALVDEYESKAWSSHD